RRAVAILVALVCALMPSAVSAYDWLQFNGDGRHGGNNSQETAISAANVHGLQRLFQVTLPSNADSAPAALQGVSTTTGLRDLVFVTTRDGHLIALDSRNGVMVWNTQHGASTCQINNPAPVPSPSNPCHTNASPAIDPNRHFVYAYGLDGYVHKHQVEDGAEVMTGGWPELATTKPFNEKGSSALSIAATPGGTYLYAANGGYPGDQGDYQGHVTTINLATGAQRIFNTLCSNQTVHFVQTPRTPDCTGQTQSAVWARPGVVYDPDTGHIYLSTGNGTFNAAQHHWGDSVLALNPDGTGNASGDPIDSYTPADFQHLQNTDLDLGSTAPAILPTPPGCAVPHLAVQGGKDGRLRLLNLDNLSGAAGPGHLGGEVPGSVVFVPGASAEGQGLMFSTPAVWVNAGVTWVFISTTSGEAGLRLTCQSGDQPSLQPIWQHTGSANYSASSPLVADGALYATINTGVLSAFDPTTGNALWTANVGGIHWESPLVANGVLYMADQNAHLTAFALPGIAQVAPHTGLPTGGTVVTITGNGFVAGATVHFGGSAATNVTVVNSTTITATTPVHALGAVTITVTNPDATVATLTNGFIFAPDAAPAARSGPHLSGTPDLPPGRSIGIQPGPLPPAPAPPGR
ncbi:MAG: PQQ-binding-like beta-propeller repeat protein, partial [Thermomicrobiales bacterium]